MAAGATFMTGKGCSHCTKSGYRGRLGIYELMMMRFQDSRAGVSGGADPGNPPGGGCSGMTTLYDDGIRKVLRGITTLEEVVRVAKRVEH